MYTSVDLGSHSIKITVSEKVNDRFYVLASTKVRSLGIKKGIIKDKDLTLRSLKEAIASVESQLGTKIKQVLLSFPLFDVDVSIETGEVDILGVVSGKDIQEVIKKTVVENIKNDYEVLYVEPIIFEVDSDLQVIDPKGLSTTRLKVRCAISTIEKEILYEYLELMQEAGLEVVDAFYGVVGDYYAIVNHDLDKKLGLLVNIGYGHTEIAIFNKGILLKGISIPLGSSSLDKDISYIYKIDKKVATLLKENFAVADSQYADKNDIMEVYNVSGEKINMDQVEISQVVEARLIEILKSVKKEINILTNREISYIMLTGGITNLTGFPYLMDSLFPYEKTVSNMTSLGIRDNSFSTTYGLVKYFDSKMKFRDITFTMFDTKDKEKMSAKKSSARDVLMEKFATYLEK